jgi:protein TonB
MLISKSDLYRKEWLDLVFANRNQQYGAYELRIHYNGVLLRALAITLLGITLMVSATVIAQHYRPEITPVPERIVMVDLSKKIYTMQPHKVKQKPAASSAKPARSIPVSTQKFVEMKPVPDAVAVDPPALNPNTAVGPVDVTVPGAPDAQNADPGTATGTGTGNGSGTGPDVYEGDIQPQIEPMPVGGEGAWSSFLQKHLHYPPQAQENNAQGRVVISFIVEKDGHLSDFNILRKAGFGFDEEALRVLKLAPAWKPGLVNGQPVRVRYTIPINFQMDN